MKKKEETKFFMEQVGGGLSKEGLKKVYGGRCVCHVNSAEANEPGTDACECFGGASQATAKANLNRACSK